MDLFHHEMRVSVLHGCIHVPVYGQDFRINLRKGIIQIVNMHFIRSQAYNLIFRDYKVLIAVRDQRGKIRSDQCTGRSVRCYQRTYLSDRIHRARLIIKHDAEAIRTLQQILQFPDCQKRIPLVKGVEHACSHFTVCLGNKLAIQMEAFGQFMVIFNNSIVDQSYLARTMWVRICIGYSAMGSPAGMTDSAVSGSMHMFFAVLPQIFHFSDLFCDTDAGILHTESDSGAVITTVFQTAEPI